MPVVGFNTIVTLGMELNSPTAEPILPKLSAASEYRRLFGRSLMALTQLKGTTAASDELCRITGVDTISPILWVTVKFLDGSKRGFRPEMIRMATVEEERSSEVVMA